MAFPENVRRFRELKGLSQPQLAEILGVTQQAISKYEKGCSMPSLADGYELAKALDTTCEELMSIAEQNLENYGKGEN